MFRIMTKSYADRHLPNAIFLFYSVLGSIVKSDKVNPTLLGQDFDDEKEISFGGLYF